MRDRWECRHSSSEMMYLEIDSARRLVRSYLDHSPRAGDEWSFGDVLAGRIDAFVRNLFGENVLEELKAAVRQRHRDPSPGEDGSGRG